MTKEELKNLKQHSGKLPIHSGRTPILSLPEYSTPVLGLIFLFADNKYSQYEAAINAEHEKLKGSRRERRSMKSPLKNADFICRQRRGMSIY